LELSDSRLGDQHIFVVDQRQRIGIARFDHGNMRQVAGGEIDVLVERISDDQDGLHAQVLELGSSQLGLGSVEREGVDHGDAAFASELGEDRTNTSAIHLLVDLLGEVLVRRARESTATPTPQRRGSHPCTSTTRTLLAPRLAGGMLDSCTVLLGTVAATGIGLEGDHDLMHQRFVEFATEHSVRSGNGGSGLTLIIQELEFHGLGSFLRRRLDCRAHDHVAILVAGNSTLDQQKASLGVYTHDVEILNGTGDITQVARHLLAREHAARILGHTDGARNTVRDRVTVGIALTSEVVTLDGTGKAFTNGGASDVNLLARFEDAFHSQNGAGGEFGGFGGVETEFLQDAASFSAGFGKVTGGRLVHAGSATCAVGDLHSSVTINFWRLHLGNAIVRHVQHSHGDGFTIFRENTGHAD